MKKKIVCLSHLAVPVTGVGEFPCWNGIVGVACWHCGELLVKAGDLRDSRPMTKIPSRPTLQFREQVRVKFAIKIAA